MQDQAITSSKLLALALLFKTKVVRPCSHDHCPVCRVALVVYIAWYLYINCISALITCSPFFFFTSASLRRNNLPFLGITTGNPSISMLFQSVFSFALVAGTFVTRALASSCVAFDVTWNLYAFNIGGSDYSLGAQDNWASTWHRCRLLHSMRFHPCEFALLQVAKPQPSPRLADRKNLCTTNSYIASILMLPRTQSVHREQHAVLPVSI